jgi:hypothetical protein
MLQKIPLASALTVKLPYPLEVLRAACRDETRNTQHEHHRSL